MKNAPSQFHGKKQLFLCVFFWSVWREVLNNEDLVDKVIQCLAIKGVQHSQLVINYHRKKRVLGRLVQTALIKN